MLSFICKLMKRENFKNIQYYDLFIRVHNYAKDFNNFQREHENTKKTKEMKT